MKYVSGLILMTALALHVIPSVSMPACHYHNYRNTGYRHYCHCQHFYYQCTGQDYQVDNACVDFCIDKRHTLNQCMRECSYSY